MSLRIVVEPRGFPRVRSAMARLSFIDTNALLDAVGAVIESQVRRRISDEKTEPDGDAWEPLDPAYAAWKKTKSSGGILELYGDLRDTITHVVVGDELEVGSNRVYAAAQQDMRPFLGLSDDNEDEIENVVVDWMDRVIGV